MGVMTKMKKGGVIAAVCSIVALGGGFTVMKQFQTSTPAVIQTYETKSEEKDYTVMVYMVGSDLESEEEEVVGAGSQDLQEMVEVMAGENAETINEKVNLVVEVGGSYQWKAQQLAGIQNGRFTIDGDGIGEVTEISNTNMGESSALSDFLNYASGTYPAENYILLFWNHGNGPVDGYGYDVLHNGDSVTLSELQEGIENSQMKDTKLQLVGFDACLMGNMETAAVMSNYANYMVASAELEPEDGWDYIWLNVFAKEGLNGEIIGQQIIEDYYQFYETKDCQVTLSCMNLGAYQEVAEDFSLYLSKLLGENNQEIYGAISQKRKQVQGFGNNRAATDSCDLVDLEQLLRILSEETWESSGLEESMDRLIPVKKEKGYVQDICGVSIYLPSGSDVMLEESLKKYQNSGFEKVYLEFVSGYGEYLLYGEELNLEEGIEQYQIQEDYIIAEITPELLSEISAVYMITGKSLPEIQGCSYILSTDSELTIDSAGKIEALPDEEYVALKGQVLCLIEQYNSQEQTDYLSPVLYNGELSMMKVRFSDENPDGEIVTIIPVSDNATSAKKEYQLEIGDKLTPLYPLFTDESTSKEQLEGREDIYETLYYIGEEIVIEEEWDALLEVVQVDLSGCQFGFMIEDNRQQFQYTEWLELEKSEIN